MKNTKIRPIIIVFVAVALIINIVLIVFKGNGDFNNSSDRNDVNSEPIRVIYEEDNIMVDNIMIDKIDSDKYLTFDVVRLDSTLQTTIFDILLLYDGDVVFKDTVVINNFGNKDSISKKVKLSKLKYDFEDLSVDLKFKNQDKLSSDELES